MIMKIIGYLCPNMEAILLAEYVLSVISTPIPSIRKWPYSCNCQKKTTISISFAKIVFPPTFLSSQIFSSAKLDQNLSPQDADQIICQLYTLCRVISRS